MKLAKITKAWFSHKDSEFEIKILLTGEIHEITEKTSDNGVTFSPGGENVRCLSQNKTKNQEMTICKSITNWKTVHDENGEEMECTEGNKLRFCREQEIDDFNEFVEDFVEWRETLSEKSKKQKEGAEKN